MSRDDYDAGVELLGKVIPAHPLLPRLRQQGYTRVNVKYVATLLAENVDSRPKEARVRRIDVAPAAPPMTEEYKQLQRRKSNLYQQRAKLSNRFHDYPDSQEERANISRDIRHVQNKIAEVQDNIYYYARTGKLPEEAPPPVERQYDGVELMKRRSSINSKMSRLRSNLKQHATTKPERVAEWERQMKECERERESLNGQIRQATL